MLVLEALALVVHLLLGIYVALALALVALAVLLTAMIVAVWPWDSTS